MAVVLIIDFMQMLGKLGDLWHRGKQDVCLTCDNMLILQYSYKDFINKMFYIVIALNGGSIENYYFTLSMPLALSIWG